MFCTFRCAGLDLFDPSVYRAAQLRFSSRLGRSGAHGWDEAAALIVERSVDLVLEFSEDVVTRHRLARCPRKRGTDGNVLLQVAAAAPISGVGNASPLGPR